MSLAEEFVIENDAAMSAIDSKYPPGTPFRAMSLEDQERWSELFAEYEEALFDWLAEEDED
jgi:hypothetical protein